MKRYKIIKTFFQLCMQFSRGFEMFNQFLFIMKMLLSSVLGRRFFFVSFNLVYYYIVVVLIPLSSLSRCIMKNVQK